MTKRCRPDQRRNPKTGRCVKKSGAIGRSLAGKSKRKSHKQKVRKNAKKSRPAAKETMSDLLVFTDRSRIPKKYFLAMKQVRGIADGHGIAMVYPPQTYDDVELLNRDSFMLSDRSEDSKNRIGYFYDDGDGLAVSGSGSDYWFVDVDGKLRSVLQRLPRSRG